MFRLKCEIEMLKCEKSGVSNVYIGETGREFGVRVKEQIRLNKNKENDTGLARHSRERHGESKLEM